MRVLFVCDAGPDVGGGHVMRCLTLAGALEQRGFQPLFLATPAVADLLDRFAPDMARLPAAADGLVAAARQAAADLLVFDHYGLSANDHAAAVGDRPMLVMDDMADRDLYADLVVNSGLAHTAADYEPLTPTRPRLLLGPTYAPLRPEFAAAREAALARRGGPVERIVVTLGLGAVTIAHLMENIRAVVGDAAVDLVVPAAAEVPSIGPTDWPQLTVHRNVRDMAGLYAAADLAIGAGGTSAWERCVLGLPSLNLILAPNQEPNADAMAAAGAAWAVDGEAPDWEFHQTLLPLLTDTALRAEMSRTAAALCDGLGADRVADAILDLVR
ncbi:UDP-2,4-diacetamido-2,4,6-trideoxy-beta-L-altropyranose hydrolase [Caulobacter sp. SLTY]|uniref:UDP-2,4-diacetamido-2,4, 6-trideoxy-beta-L-altropyranose hydrolase n=1 Tax=Caulobacter sp. SLTY TaxID=2683262 RepID=UPI00141291A6|nr:UDP-2,4-diacetamido-2,4,6-trideoxy-beta-L-altropyranose hydrolase [Caulobacter sp. SLTY]NBB17331.1 UDP-2,4-diacetamido-2,4,6-trideoxy-beta-L-altropyranose hydrolase [Caulobacter sp. SLTY]